LIAFSAELKATLPYDSLNALRSGLFAAHPEMAQVDVVRENTGATMKPKKLGKANFKNAVADHYLTNPITRASEVMAELSKNAKNRDNAAIAAE
jgi:NADH-quinone oxidoreductase subunit G